MKKYISLFISYLLIASNLYSYFDHNTVWEIRNTATPNNTNGGTFIPGLGGTDYSQQDTAQYIIGEITSAGAGNVLLSTAAATDWLGNGFFPIGGTNMLSYPTLWQITAVTPGVDFTVQSTGTANLNISTGVIANGRIRIGGALSLNNINAAVGITDDAVFESIFASNTVWIKAGSYNIPGSISVANGNCNFSSPSYITGYNEIRGDTGYDSFVSTKIPVLLTGAFNVTLSLCMNISNLGVSGLSTGLLTIGNNTDNYNVYVRNSSSSSGRSALANPSSTLASIHNSDISSINGTGMVISNANFFSIKNCYFHDSNIGLNTGNTFSEVNNSIFVSNRSGNVSSIMSNYTGGKLLLTNNTFIGFKNLEISSSIIMTLSTSVIFAQNNIFADGWRAFDKAGPAMRSTNIERNYFYNFQSTFSENFSDRDIYRSSYGVNPQFYNDTELYGTTAAINGSVLEMHGGGMFGSAGITDNLDVLHCHWGTGATSGGYVIIGHSSYSVTLNNAIGTDSNQDKVWTIRIGKDYRVGTNMKSAGLPYKISTTSSTTFIDVGAVQREEQGTVGASGGSFTFFQ